MNQNRFVIRNDWTDVLAVCVEPESALVHLCKGEEVVIHDTFAEFPATVKFSRSGEGQPILSIWPGDGDILAEKDGVNVLESAVDQRVSVKAL
ncbi:MAG TPA: hypothetical protein VN641_02915 [Urbifossiella sp.]|nr:hypothetical protein [Urbifossiella sp.]